MRAIILVVDDHPELVDGVKLTLEMEGYQVLAAASGSEALTILERITPDLILADIMMPEMDGYELYERVHSDERWVRVPFIFLTAIRIISMSVHWPILPSPAVVSNRTHWFLFPTTIF